MFEAIVRYLQGNVKMFLENMFAMINQEFLLCRLSSPAFRLLED